MRSSLLDDQSGIALIYVTIALPVIIGFALLAVDVGRFMTLQSSLQHGADALALAGAAELDGTSNSITRANQAMQVFVTDNKALFTTSVATVKYSDLETPCYLETIPSSDTAPINTADCLSVASANLADSSERARFVYVKVAAKTYNTVFPVSFLGGLTNTPNTAAEAVAGFQNAVCNFTPLFMCNPLETAANKSTATEDHGLFAYAQNWRTRRNAFKLVAFASAGTTTAVPGQFGFLDPVAGNGANDLKVEIASEKPDLCYIQTKITPKTGGMSTLREAFNLRFDLYPNSATLSPTVYPPATNVRKGFIYAKKTGPAASPNFNRSGADPCTNNELATANTDAFLGLPVDSCYATNSCTNANIGNGNWGYDPDIPATGLTFSKYWATNFQNSPLSATSQPSAPIPTYAQLGLDVTNVSGITSSSMQIQDSEPPPRYDVYLYENKTSVSVGTDLLKNYLTNSRKGSTYYPANLGETGKPICSTKTPTVDRRIIYAAVMNCLQQDLRPGGSGGPYTAVGFAKLFMVRPIVNDILWAEFVDVVRPGDGSGVSRDMVQLYR